MTSNPDMDWSDHSASPYPDQKIRVEPPDSDMAHFNRHDAHCEICGGHSFVTDATGKRIRCPA